MRDTRWTLGWRGLLLHRARSLLVLLAVGFSLAGAGTVLNAWALVRAGTAQGFAASLPVSATLVTAAPIAPALRDELRQLPGMAAARLRRSVAASVQGQGAWRAAQLVALDDFAAADIARLQPEAGAWPPPAAALVIEQSSLAFAEGRVGETLSVQLDGGAAQTVPLAGAVRDVSLAPGWMEHLVVAFATPALLQQLGAPPGFNELQLRVQDTALDRDGVRRIAAAAQARLEQAGHTVLRVEVPEPGQHVHAAQMNSLLLTQGAFGLLALLVSGCLVLNLVNATLAGQARQIGVMKTLGAGRAPILALYLGQAAALGLAATAIALPLAWAAGRQYAALKAELLNFRLDGLALPAWSPALQLAVGLLLPLLAALGPVWRIAREPVAAALRDIGIVRSGQALASRRRLPTAGLSRPLLLAIGNAFRRRQRMLLTLLALASGGAVFLAAGSLRVAVRDSVDLLYAAQRWQLSLRLAQPADAAAIETAARGVDGVQQAEAWRSARAMLQRTDGLTSDSFSLLGVPPEGRLLQPPVRAGRWLQPGDAAALVPSQSWLRQQGLGPKVRVGDRLTLRIEGQRSDWTVVGLVDSGPQPLVYAPRAALDALAGNRLASTLVVGSTAQAGAAQRDLVQRLRAALADAAAPVGASHLQAEQRRVAEDHLLMVVDFLGAMGWVMLAVGAMGLASTMGLNVLERAREIGVLRAIGAGNGAILGLIQAEGLVVVGLAWALALLLSVPVSLLLGRAFGRIMFEVPPNGWPGARALLGGGALMLAISLLACAGPALRAMRLPAARVLSYE